MNINLIVQYYKCGKEDRQREIDTCLSKNLSNKFITSVHLLTEQLSDFSRFPQAEKIKQTVISERLTFDAAFQYANQYEEQQIWLLGNADIYFDESLGCLIDSKLDETIFALTRYDVQKDGSSVIVDPAFAHGSQDAWIFKTPIRLSQLSAKFFLGIPGCDNRIAHEFINAGYKVINPSKIIVAYHLDLIRGKNIFERGEEYAKFITEENINRGLVASPPYQYHLYPVDQIDPNSLGMYKFYMSKIANYKEQINELERYKNQNDQLLQSWGWKVTRPLLVAINYFFRVISNKP